MKTLLLALAVFASPAAFAGSSIEMRVSLSTSATFSAVSATSYRATSGTTTTKGMLAASVDGRYVQQDIPETTQTADSGAQIDLLGNDQIRLTGTDAQSAITMRARFAQDGSFRVSGNEMSRAMRALVADKLEATKRQLEAQGGEVRMSIHAADMICRKAARALACSYGASIVLKASSR